MKKLDIAHVATIRYSAKEYAKAQKNYAKELAKQEGRSYSFSRFVVEQTTK